MDYTKLTNAKLLSEVANVEKNVDDFKVEHGIA
jgi:hypothetical protein